MRSPKGFLSGLFLVLFLAACTTTPTGRSQLMLVSPDSAIQASAEAYPKMLEKYARAGRLNKDPARVRRVKEITGRLVAEAMRDYPHTRNWKWQVVVIDEPETVNAWCMAGGKMAIYSGLLEKIRPTDDELAQVMAHEIAHAVANHVAEQMSIALASQVGLAILSATALKDSRYHTAALTGAALAASLAIELPYSRKAEAEADRIGIELAAKAGYDPRAAVTLWQKMEKVGGSRMPEFLSTHPAPASRQQALRALVPQMMKYYDPKASHPVYRGL